MRNDDFLANYDAGIFLFLHKNAQEVMGNEMSWLLCKKVSGATDTRVSGNHADFNMQSQIYIPHALVSSLMYVVHEMSKYMMCKSHFLQSWTHLQFLTFA